MKQVKIFTIFSAILFMSAGLYAEGGFVGDETCVGCHDEAGASYSESLHSRISKISCESCHGSGAAHAGSGDVKDIASYNDDDEMNSKVDKICSTCHLTMMHGVKGAHIDDYGLNCGSCHKIHQSARYGVNVKTGNSLCESCHTAVRAKTMLPSHHPVREGKMECTSCHDMKGGSTIDSERPNDLCLDCHTQYRGPFVYEHAAVAESCNLCHDPHGSVANNLLKQNEPFLCLQCHQMHFHSQKAGEEGTFTPPNHPDREIISDKLAVKRGFTTKCTQCHQAIHGSDLPSQEISNQGRALTR